jgi:hypothetical protein
MTGKQWRWLLLTVASGLVAFVIVRRRTQLAAALPQPLIQQAERFVIPWSTLDRSRASDEAALADDETGDGASENDEQDAESPRRKVSSTNRISFLGKRYGPLPDSLIGQYVEVETRDNTLFVLHEGTPIANFELQS